MQRPASQIEDKIRVQLFTRSRGMIIEVTLAVGCGQNAEKFVSPSIGRAVLAS
ncbi:MAG: hypothetical protein ABSH35_25130 [Isosphaeraceae bacterium]|jgi:hypothetical protein